MSGFLVVLTKCFIEKELPVSVFVDKFIDRYRVERNTGLLGSYGYDTGGLLSTIFCMADNFNEDDDRLEYEFDEQRLRDEVIKEISINKSDFPSIEPVIYSKYQGFSCVDHEHIPNFNEILFVLHTFFLGEIVPRMRGITYSIDSAILIRVVYDVFVSDDDTKFNVYFEVVLRSLLQQFDVKVEIKQLNYPEELETFALCGWLYLRKEPYIVDFDVS